MIFRFVAALGTGGERAIGAALLSETWPKAWRPWIAAVIQTGVNIGVLCGALVVGLLSFLLPPGSDRWVFLVGVLPALMVFWIRRHVPAPETWQRAGAATAKKPGALDLFRGAARSVTVRTSVVCAPGLSAWWLLLFWQTQHLRKLLAAARTPAAETTRSSPTLSSPSTSPRSSATSPAAVWPATSATGGRSRSCLSDSPLRSSARSSSRASSPRWPVLAAARRIFRRRLRALHDVSATAFPDPPPHHRRRLLLQHRPYRRRGCLRGFRLVRPGRQLSRRAPLRQRPCARRRRSLVVVTRDRGDDLSGLRRAAHKLCYARRVTFV